SLRKFLSIAYTKLYAFAALLKLLFDCLLFSQPQLLRLVYISLYQSARFGLWSVNVAKPDPLEGFMYAGLFVCHWMHLSSLIFPQYFQRAFERRMRIRSGLVDVLYQQALVLSNDELDRFSGDLVNLMSVDATRLQIDR
ncbi:hypothetical protein F5879DRAFT_810778, partial [Lentinula edodes]|uniref:uncharacterized protein n=1 Tax=Lentinula edodes TaxID=5353 RepID=UPI001E8D69DB